MLESPLVATATVAAVHAQLTTEDFYTDHVSLAALPHLLLLLLRVQRAQECAHTRIIALVSAALPVVGAERADAARALLRLWLEALRRGRALEVLDAAARWADDADPALQRYFALQVRPLLLMIQVLEAQQVVM